MTDKAPVVTSAGEITVDVVYALPDTWQFVRLSLPLGVTVRHAVRKSGLDQSFPGLDLLQAPIGVWGAAVPDERIANDGDRIEIYRGLAADPREKRRLLARRGETMGPKSGTG